MPPNYMPDGYGELWIPSAFGIPTNSIRPNVDPRPIRGSNYLDVYGRLKPGVTLEKARSQMDAISRRLENQYADDNSDTGIRVMPLHEDAVGKLRPVLLLLFAAVGFLVFIGCANVANLLLARAATRSREISIRAAMGASRLRLIRQLAYRERADLAHGRGARCVARRVGDPLLDVDGASRAAELQGGRPQWPGPRLQPRRVGYHRHFVRARPGAFFVVWKSGGRLETGRTRKHRRRKPAARVPHRD